MTEAQMGTVQVSEFRFGEGFTVTLETWQLNGNDLGELISEQRKWQRLKLRVRTKDPTVARQLRDRAGEYDLIPKSDGTYKAVDRAGGLNTFDLFPPSGRSDVRTTQKYLAKNYDETLIDQSGEVYEVKVDLVAEDPKQKQQNYGTLSPGNSEWKFAFDAGDVTTRRVNKNIANVGQGGVEGVKLDIGLEADEVKVLEESLRKLNGATIRKVPDGENVVEDESAGQTNTVDITSPLNAGISFEDGEYVVSEYTTNWLNEAFYRVTLKATKK
ncbi:hypothetical protein HCTV-16_gp134 [Haloarcula virus HCTV-16]|nr:hypothetical protein HCTV-16_gp134 [Haloarcula virus HCTV-16]